MKRRVLILGAGASKPFGLPTGPELRRRVLEITQDNGELFFQATQGSISRERVKEFHNAFGGSGLPSIDQFLAHRGDFDAVGRIAIAAALLPMEVKPNVVAATDSDWYGWLFSGLVNRAGSPEGILELPLTIVTFNYDRSLETFLFHAVWNTFGMMRDDAAEFVRQFGIIRPHGSLGTIFPGDPDGIPFGQGIGDPNAVRTASKQIRIVGEATDESGEVGRARDALREAEDVIFLGFGYHSKNMEVLQFPDLAKDRLVRGSAYQLADTEREAAGRFGVVNLGSPRSQCLAFLRESVSL